MTGKAGSILIVDDNKSILTALKLLLGNYFNRVVTLPAPTALVSTLRSEKFDVVLLDMNFSAGINNGNEGLYWLSEVKKSLLPRRWCFLQPMPTSIWPSRRSKRGRSISL